MKSLKKSDPHSSAVAIIGFLVIVIGFSIFTLFNVNKDSIMSSNSFQSFIILVVVGMALLLAVFYHATQSKPSHRKKK